MALHEIIHTQGAVLYGSPNSNGTHHCWRDKDVMCYSYRDGSEPCPTAQREQVDCAHTGAGTDSNGQ